MLTFLGSIWGKIAAAGAAIIGVALVVWRFWANAKKAGRQEAELKARRKHDAAVENANRSAADVGSGSDRDKRLSKRFDRDQH